MSTLPENYKDWAAQQVPEIGGAERTLRRTTFESDVPKCPVCGLYPFLFSHAWICGCPSERDAQSMLAGGQQPSGRQMPNPAELLQLSWPQAIIRAAAALGVLALIARWIWTASR